MNLNLIELEIGLALSEWSYLFVPSFLIGAFFDAQSTSAHLKVATPVSVHCRILSPQLSQDISDNGIESRRSNRSDAHLSLQIAAPLIQ